MALVSSKRIVFINIDTPPEKVADYIESYTDNLISRLNLHRAAYWNVDLESEQVCFESIIESASCVVIGALWPFTLPRKTMLLSFMRKLLKQQVPLLVLGTAEPILLEAIGSAAAPCRSLGLKAIQQTHHADIMSFSPTQTWIWWASEQQAINVNYPSEVISQTTLGEIVLIRHNDFLYSSPVVLGITATDIACWVQCFPQYLKGNEAAIESALYDDNGLIWLKDYLQMWNDKLRDKRVH